MAIDFIKDLDLNCNIFRVADYQGYTQLEILNIFFTKINELIEAQNKVINIADYLVNNGLKQEVANRIEIMLKDGTLIDVIGEELLTSINSKVGDLQEEITNLKESNTELKLEISEQIKEIKNNCSTNMSTLENKINSKIEELENNCTSIKEKIVSLENKIITTTSKAEDNREDITYLQGEIEKLREMIKNSNGGDVEVPKITTRIAIDSGHGGTDPGTAYPGSSEAEQARLIVNKCISILQKNGCTNILDVENSVPKISSSVTVNQNLNLRTKKINEWGADVCVSIHFNSNSGTPGTGSEAYVISKGGKAEVYADRILKNICNAIGTVNRGVKVGNLAIVRDTVCPATLIEVLFANNPNDVAKMDVDKVAMAVAEGILNKKLTETAEVTNYLTGKISKNGMRLIKAWEGFSENPYTDTLGFRTVGYGLTEKWRPDDFKNMQPFPTTEVKASEYLVQAVLEDYGKTVFNYITKKGKIGVISQNIFDCLVSIAYNKGATGLVNSSLMETILENPSNPNIEEMMKTYEIRPGTSAEQGLRNRRIDEWNMYTGVNPTKKIGIYNGTTPTGRYVEENNGYGHIPSSIL